MYKNHKRKLIQTQRGINVTGDNINVIAVHSQSAEGQCGASFKEATLKATMWKYLVSVWEMLLANSKRMSIWRLQNYDTRHFSPWPHTPLQKWQSFKTSEGIQMCKSAQKVAVLSELKHLRSQSTGNLHYLQKWTHKKGWKWINGQYVF